MNIRMKNMGRVVHTILECSIQVRERFGAAAEAHALAQVIPPVFAVIAVITHDTGLDSNALARHKIFNSRADSGYYPCCFMAKYEGCL